MTIVITLKLYHGDHCDYIEISLLKQISEIEHDCLTGEGRLTSLTRMVSVRMLRKLFFSRLIVPIYDHQLAKIYCVF